MSDSDEVRHVASSIFEFKMSEQKNSDFAILYRTNAQSRAMEDALKRDIPYRIFEGLHFINERN